MVQTSGSSNDPKTPPPAAKEETNVKGSEEWGEDQVEIDINGNDDMSNPTSPSDNQNII